MQYKNVANMRVPPASRFNSMASSQFVSQTGNSYSGFQQNSDDQQKKSEGNELKSTCVPSFLNSKRSQNVTQSMIFNSGSCSNQNPFPNTLSNMAKYTRGSVESSLNSPPSFLKTQQSRTQVTSSGKKDLTRQFQSPNGSDREKKLFQNSSIVSDNASNRARVDSLSSSNKEPFSPINPKRMRNETLQLLSKKMSNREQTLPTKKQDEQSTHNSCTKTASHKVPQFLKKQSPEASENSSKNESEPSHSRSQRIFNVQKIETDRTTIEPPQTFGFNGITRNQKPSNFVKKKTNEPLSASFRKQINTPQSNPVKPELPNFQLGRLSSPSAFNNRKRLDQAPREFTLRDFELLDKIGKGAFGDVYIAQEIKTGFMCVLKKVSKRKIREQNLQEHILREIKIQAFLNHRHLTQIFGVFSEEDYFYLILELLPDGAMSQVHKKKKIPEKQAARYVRQICEGLRFMHKEDIIHRDLKPENIFMHEDYLKIGDFGCAVYTHTLRNTIVGCLAYISPEQFNNQSYDDKIDVWSVGVLTYEILTGKPPFESDIMQISQQTSRPFFPKLTFPEELHLSDNAKAFMQSLLAASPEDRLSLDQAMKHPFLTKQFEEDRKAEQEVFEKFQQLWRTES